MKLTGEWERSQLNKVDSQALELNEFLEGESMDDKELSENQEALMECLTNLSALITTEQEEQGWI